MKNLKSRNNFLMEKIETSLILEAGSYNNNGTWSETMVAKLFSWAFRVITLDGFLTDKFKDLLGAKSFIIKNLAKRLEKTIDKLPGEYIERNDEIDYQNLEMQFYDELLNIIEMMNKSKYSTINNISEDLDKHIDIITQISDDLNSSDDKQSKLIETIKTKLKVLEQLHAKVKEKMNGLTEVEVVSKTGFNLSNFIKSIGNKNEIKRKVDELKAKLINNIKDEKDSGKITTESMFKIISILNKARNLYMEEDREGETVYRGNKRETVFSPNRRLFSLWEEKVIDILSRKNSIIPKNLLTYINNSLASIDPVKYNFEVESGVQKNVLDQLSDVDRAVGKANKKFGRVKITPTDVIPQGKSEASSFHLNDHDRLTISQATSIRSLLMFTIKDGIYEYLNKERTEISESKFDGYSMFFIPVRTYVNGMVLGVLTFNEKVLNNVKTSNNHKIEMEDLHLSEYNFYTNDAGYRYAIINSKDLSIDNNYVMKIFNPGVKIGKGEILKMENDKIIEAITIHDLESIKSVYGNDDKIVELNKNSLSKHFNLNVGVFRQIEHYFNANKF